MFEKRGSRENKRYILKSYREKKMHKKKKRKKKKAKKEGEERTSERRDRGSEDDLYDAMVRLEVMNTLAPGE